MCVGHLIFGEQWCALDCPKFQNLGDEHDSRVHQNYPPHNHIGIPCMEMGRETKKFPYGDSPFPNRVCSNLGINIYTLCSLGLH